MKEKKVNKVYYIVRSVKLIETNLTFRYDSVSGKSTIFINSYRAVYATGATVLIRTIVTVVACITSTVRINSHSLPYFEVLYRGANRVYRACEFVTKSEKAILFTWKRSL